MESIGRYLTRIGYYKSEHSIPEYDGGIFISREKVKCMKSKYEELTDSHGNKHRVQVDCKISNEYFNDKDFHVNNDSYSYWQLEHKKIPINKIEFQLNLKKYLIIPPERVITNYQGCRDIGVEIFTNDLYRCMRWMESGYNPIYEVVYGYSSHKICNYVSDKVFFRYKNREFALQRIHPRLADKFKKDGYLKMNKSELVTYLAKRLSDKASFVREYKLEIQRLDSVLYNY